MHAQRPTLNGKGMVYRGDQTSHGGVVLTGFALSTWNGIPQARLGDQVFCPKCTPHEHVISGVSGMNVHGVQSAMHNDLTSCGATLVAHGASPAELATAIAFKHGGAHDEQFLLKDAQDRPMSYTLYTLKFPDGRLHCGETDETGHTDRIFTAQGQDVEIYIGHLTKKEGHE